MNFFEQHRHGGAIGYHLWQTTQDTPDGPAEAIGASGVISGGGDELPTVMVIGGFDSSATEAKASAIAALTAFGGPTTT